MKLKGLFVLTLLMFLPIIGSAFATEELKPFKREEVGFEMQIPEKWFEMEDQELVENVLERYAFSDEKLKALLDTNKGSVPLGVFMKHKPSTYGGIISTIKINMRANPAQDDETFLEMMKQASKSIAKQLPNYKEISSPRIITINGKDMVFFESDFDLKDKAGNTHEIIAQTYAIPSGNYFFQLNFSSEASSPEVALHQDLSRTLHIKAYK